MPDFEKVIKGLEAIVNDDWMWKKADYYAGLCKDALALLKAQEPVEPVFDEGDGKTIGQFLCGKCHAKIGFEHPHFCWHCGRAVKWDG